VAVLRAYGLPDDTEELAIVRHLLKLCAKATGQEEDPTLF